MLILKKNVSKCYSLLASICLCWKFRTEYILSVMQRRWLQQHLFTVYLLNFKLPSHSLVRSSFNTKGVFPFFDESLLCICAILAANLCLWFDLLLNHQHPSQDELESLLCYCNNCAVNYSTETQVFVLKKQTESLFIPT